MEKYENILTAIQAVKETMKTTAKEARDAFYKEMTAVERLMARKAGAADFLKRDAETKQAEEDERHRNEVARVKIAILSENAKRAFFAENIGKICEIWNKYAGKQHGEKTAEKIREELKTATGARVFIFRHYNETQINIYLQFQNGCALLPPSETELNAYIKGSTPTDDGNKIKHIDGSAARLYYCDEYVEDVDGHTAAFFTAREALKEAEKKATEARSAYNSLTRGNMARATERGCPTFIF